MAQDKSLFDYVLDIAADRDVTHDPTLDDSVYAFMQVLLDMDGIDVDEVISQDVNAIFKKMFLNQKLTIDELAMLPNSAQNLYLNDFGGNSNVLPDMHAAAGQSTPKKVEMARDELLDSVTKGDITMNDIAEALGDDEDKGPLDRSVMTFFDRFIQLETEAAKQKMQALDEGSFFHNCYQDEVDNEILLTTEQIFRSAANAATGESLMLSL